MSFRLRVPASSANLGPGFDALGLALELHLTCDLSVATELAISATGLDADVIPTDESNLIWCTAMTVATHQKRHLPAIELAIHNEIPLGKGLGSSAAALTAGVVIADHLLELNWSRDQILNEAARIEGHPDNVSACVLGSIVASAMIANSKTHAVKLMVLPSFSLAVVVPDFALPTVKARAVLPESYSRADVVFNVQRSSLLIAALCTGDTRGFQVALEDRLHQPYRAPLIPGLSDMLSLRHPGLLGCSLSGAGPSVLVFYEPGCHSVTELFRELFARNGCGSQTYLTEIQRTGYTVENIG